MPTAGYLQDAKNQQKRLAETITAKGITATATEKYKNLIDKVAQIENLKGEERTLENFTNVLSEPKSIVQLEYPIDNMITVPYTGSQAGSSITAVVNSDNSVTFNGTATGVSTYYNFKSFPTLDAGTYAYSMQDVPGCHYTLGVVKKFDEGTTSGTISVTTDKTGSYFVLNIPAGTTLNNVTVRQPVLYKVPAPKTLNAKLGSKNLIPYPYAGKTSTSNGITFTVNDDGSVTASGTATAQAAFYLYNNSNVPNNFPVKANQNYTASGLPSGSSATTYFIRLTTLIDTHTNDFYTGQMTHKLNISSDDYIKWAFIVIAQGATVNNLVFKPQIELGTTATAYTPYIFDFSTVNITRCGKNLLSSPYIDGTTKTLNGITWTVNSDGSITANGTATANASFWLSRMVLIPGQVYTISNGFSSLIRGVSLVANYYPTGSSNYKAWLNVQTSKTGAFPSDGDRLVCYCLIVSGTTVENLTFKPQLELGSTATTYEPYQGQSYTPTTTGEVTGITNLYPTTTLLTNNAGVVFEQVTGGFYKEILPSTDKNGITKVYQPSVDSSIDSNIKPENIKKGVKILGILGTYDGN